jgi:hypothetical protein
MRLALLLALVAGCSHIPPADATGVPPPWPAPSPSLVRKGAPAPAAEPASKPPVPPQKNDVLPPANPVPPQS